MTLSEGPTRVLVPSLLRLEVVSEEVRGGWAWEAEWRRRGWGRRETRRISVGDGSWVVCRAPCPGGG